MKPNKVKKKNQAQIEAEQAEENLRKQFEIELFMASEKDRLMKEFSTAPRTRIDLASAFGMNNPYNPKGIRNEYLNLSAPFVALSNPQEYHRQDNQQNDPIIKVAYSIGKQVAVRAINSTEFDFLPMEEPAAHITAIGSQTHNEKMVIAVAVLDLEQPGALFIHFFEQNQRDKKGFTVSRERLQVLLPEIEEEEKEPVKEKSGCEYHHSKKTKDVAPEEEEKEDPVRSVITQVEFSQNMLSLAVLIQGQDNGIMVYEWKSHDRPTSQVYFDQEKEEAHPKMSKKFGAGLLVKKQTLNRAVKTSNAHANCKKEYTYIPKVTKISFNPCITNTLLLTGPNGEFGLYKFEQRTIKKMGDGGYPFIIESFGSDAFFTGQSWSSDGDVVAGCTRDGWVFAASSVNGFHLQKQFKGRNFVDVQICEHGLVAATTDCEFFFYKMDQLKQFTYVRSWQFDRETFAKGGLTPENLLHSIRVLNVTGSPTKTRLIAGLNNKNAFSVNLWDQIFSPDKQDELSVKLADYEKKAHEEAKRRQHEQFNQIDEDQPMDSGRNNKKQILDIKYSMIGGGFHSNAISSMDVCLQRPIILTVSKVDQTINLWNYVSNQCELTVNFAMLDQITGEVVQRPLVCAALHPSGYYLAVGTTDQIKLFHILHGELREPPFHTYDVKRTKILKFSSGGQYLAAADPKTIKLYSTFSLEKVQEEDLACPSPYISDLCFTEMDSRLTTVSSDGFVQKYDLTGTKMKKLGESFIDKNVNFTSCVFLQDRVDDTKSKVIAVGGQKDVGPIIRVFTDEEMEENLVAQPSILAGEESATEHLFNSVSQIITSQNQIKNFLIATNQGTLQVFADSFVDQFTRERWEKHVPLTLEPQHHLQVVHSHNSSIRQCLVSPDSQYIFTIGEDGALFVYSITEVDESADAEQKKKMERIQASQKEAATAQTNTMSSARYNQTIEDQRAAQVEQVSKIDPKKVFIDPALAQIVLVSKDVMIKWREDQEKLKNSMEETSNNVESQLRHEKYKYEKDIAQMEKDKTDELNELNKKYEALQMQEAEQKDDNTQQMKKMEINHDQCKEELQELYETKLAYEQRQFRELKIQQENMKSQYEQEISELNRQHETHIETMLFQFKESLQKVQEKYEASKRTADGLKMINEEKLTQQEEEQDEEITKLRENQKDEREEMEGVISDLKKFNETLKWQQDRLDKEIGTAKDKKKREKAHIRVLEQMLEKQRADIKKHEKAKKGVQETLKQMETELYRQKFKIKELQKTKQVLTHRTQEMKSSLEPKEQQIEQLKEQLTDLDKLFNKSEKNLANLKQEKEQRKEEIKNIYQSLLKEKAATKREEKTIQEFIKKINETYIKEEKFYVTGLMHIYTKYAKQFSDEILEQKKKDPETIEELDKQVKYMEKSINMLKISSQKNQTKNKSNIRKQTAENRILIKELQQYRLQQKQTDQDMLRKDMDINSQNLEKKRLETAIMKQRDKIKELQQQQAIRHKQTGGLFKRPATTDEQERDLARKQTQSRGKIIKGPTKPVGIFKRKIQELQDQLEENNQTILLQKLQITSLRDEFIAAVQDHKEMQEYQQMQVGQLDQLQRQFDNLHEQQQEIQQEIHEVENSHREELAQEPPM